MPPASLGQGKENIPMASVRRQEGELFLRWRAVDRPSLRLTIEGTNLEAEVVQPSSIIVHSSLASSICLAL